jgi:Fungal specific transcription factor domain
LEHPARSTPSAALCDISVRPSESERSSIVSEFPSIYFLDFELYQRTIAEIPRAITSIRPELEALTNDIREQAKVYFSTIHPWIPFLSKKSFNERLLSPFAPRSTDITLLFACIKLVCSAPNDESVCSDAYVTVKNSLLEAEIAGVFSVRILQAWILLCIYEFGHAVYPSAYLSIGVCARYAVALGITLKGTNSQMQTNHWIETEERARALWAVVILDR